MGSILDPLASHWATVGPTLGIIFAPWRHLGAQGGPGSSLEVDFGPLGMESDLLGTHLARFGSKSLPFCTYFGPKPKLVSQRIPWPGASGRPSSHARKKHHSGRVPGPGGSCRPNRVLELVGQQETPFWEGSWDRGLLKAKSSFGAHRPVRNTILGGFLGQGPPEDQNESWSSLARRKHHSGRVPEPGPPRRKNRVLKLMGS